MTVEDPSSDNSVSNKVKIDILLKEYDTLRTEIISRITSRFALVGTVAGLLTFVLFLLFKVEDEKFLLNTLGFWIRLFLGGSLLVTSIIIGFVIWYWLGLLIRNCSCRISNIEKRINKLADDQLLEWETRNIEEGTFHELRQSGKLFRWITLKKK